MLRGRGSMARFLTAAAAFMCVFVITVAAWALELNEARARGLVGETPRGYISPVQSPTPEVSALVHRINRCRRAGFARVAEQTGTRLQQVEALAAQKMIRQLPPVFYVHGNDW